MILDQQTVLWDNVALTTGTVVSTNTYDCGTSGLGGPASASGDAIDPSGGYPLAMIVFVTVAALKVGTETIEFDFIQSANAALTTPTILVSVKFATAGAPQLAMSLLAAGAVIVVPIPAHSITARYVGGQYIGANTSGISITVFLSHETAAQAQRNFPTAIVIKG